MGFSSRVACLLLFVSTSHQLQVKNGTNGYVTYQIGGRRTNVVISAPHGGTLKPGNLPDRPENGCYDSANDECIYQAGCSGDDDVSNCKVLSELGDWNTQHLAVELADSIQARFKGRKKRRPHVVRCELHRSKLDANRDLSEAAFGNAEAALAWEEYHGFIDEAKRAVRGNVFYIDVHGHSLHDWNMIGVLLSKSGSNGFNKAVLPDRLAQYSSIMQLHVDSGVSMEELVRGNTSIGGFLQPFYETAPSPVNKDAGSRAFYSGGYSLRRHTGWKANGIQVEAIYAVRSDETVRKAFADKLAKAIIYWIKNYL